MTLRQSRKNPSVEHREYGWNGFAYHLTDTGMPPFFYRVSPLEGARNGLEPATFGGTEDPILPRMQRSITSDMPARGCYGCSRSGRIHPPVAGVSESFNQPQRTIHISYDRPKHWTLAMRAHGLRGGDALRVASHTVVRLPSAGTTSRWYRGHHFVPSVTPNGHPVHRIAA